jgi:hypothetical protein
VNTDFGQVHLPPAVIYRMRQGAIQDINNAVKVLMRQDANDALMRLVPPVNFEDSPSEKKLHPVTEVITAYYNKTKSAMETTQILRAANEHLGRLNSTLDAPGTPAGKVQMVEKFLGAITGFIQGAEQLERLEKIEANPVESMTKADKIPSQKSSWQLE